MTGHPAVAGRAAALPGWVAVDRDGGFVAVADQRGEVGEVAGVAAAAEDDLDDGGVPDRVGLELAPPVPRLRQRLQDGEGGDAGAAALGHQRRQRRQRREVADLVQREQQRYRIRRNRLVQALAQAAPHVRLSGVAAGMHALVEFPPNGRSEDEVVERAAGLGRWGCGESPSIG